MTEDEARAQMVAIALSYEGCSAAPSTRSRYADLLCTSVDDFNDPRSRSEALVQSGCARVRLGFEWAAGLRLPRLLQRYRTGMAVADVEDNARDCGAWRPPTHTIKAGDGVVIIGKAGPHVLTAIRWEGSTLISIDGGQRDANGFEAILLRRRVFIAGLEGGALDNCAIAGVSDWGVMAAREEW